MRPYRKERIANLIREVVCEAISQRLNDPRVEPLTTVTRVEMSPDLLIARIYLTVPGGDTAQRKTLTAIQHAAKYIQRLVAKELTTRNCPELRFDTDQILKLTQDTLNLIEENRKEYSSLDAEETDPNDPAPHTNRTTNIENESMKDQHP